MKEMKNEIQNEMQEIIRLVHAFAKAKFKEALSKTIKEDLINILQAKNIEEEIKNKLMLFNRKNNNVI